MNAESAAADLTIEERNAIFRSLRQLKREHENTMNADELAELLIGATIVHGFNSGKRITGTLTALGMNKRHVGIILDRLIGVRWQRDAEGLYSLLT